MTTKKIISVNVIVGGVYELALEDGSRPILRLKAKPRPGDLVETSMPHAGDAQDAARYRALHRITDFRKPHLRVLKDWVKGCREYTKGAIDAGLDAEIRLQEMSAPATGAPLHGVVCAASLPPLPCTQEIVVL